jgi:uncharacterized membrane protein
MFALVHGYGGPIGFFPLGLFGGLAGLLLLAGFVLAVVWLIRAMTGPTTWRQGYAASPAAASESPLDILSRRFASGEITAEDYQKARDLLRETPRN